MADDGYTVGNEAEQSQYQDVMQCPILAENAVDDASTNGICALFDYKSSKTTWSADQVPTNQTLYPRTGKFIKELKTQKILYADVNRCITHQPFRITDVLTNDTEIVVNSTHIIGEFLANNPIVNPKNGTTIGGANWTAQMCGDAILSSLVKPVPQLNFDSDVSKVANIALDVSSSNALNLLIDPDQQGDKPVNSVLANFGGHFIFDGFTIYHRQNPGVDRNITIHYGNGGKGSLKTYSQEKNIAETYVAIYPFATYTPGQLQATKDNIDWNSLIQSTNWTSIGSVTYSARGSVDVYDCPVKGNTVIRQVTTGEHLTLGPALSNGTMLKTIDGHQAQVTTVNEDSWYPISPEDGGGWIDAQFVNFSKNGDYLINNVYGHVTVDSKGTDTKLQRYPITGYATVTYTQGNQKIHVYYAPDQGPDHYRTGKMYKNGARVHYDYYAVDENGKPWYRIGPHEWLYGPHLSISKNNDVQTYPSRGVGYVKSTAKKYYINKTKGTVTEAKHHLSLTQAKRQHKKQYLTVYRGKGKKRQKLRIENPNYLVGDPIKHKKGYYNLDYGQVVVAGTTYYKLSNGSYVKKFDIDQHARKTQLPQTPSKIMSETADTKGKIEMYSTPSKGSAANWSIPDGESFAIDHSAEGADGQTWYEVTYKGVTGWIPAESTSTSAPTDMEPTTRDDSSAYGDQDTQPVEEQTVTVGLDDNSDENVYNGALYADGMYASENAHIMKLDLSSEFKHDDQDQSGLQPDGSWVATPADKQQLLTLAKGKLKIYDIGHFPVSLQADYSDLDGEKADLLALNMYDYVNVDFTDYDDQIEKGQVNATVWNMAGEDSSYDSVTIGDIPKTLAHELLDQAQEQTNNAVARSTARTRGLLNQYDQMLQQEGSNREAAEKNLMKQLGLIQEVTKKNGEKIDNQLVTNQEFENRMQSIADQSQEMVDWVTGGGSGVIQATPNWQNPEMLTATAADGSKMAFSGNGLIFFDPGGNQREKAGLTSEGKMYADNILAGTIEAVSIKACTINSSLAFQDPYSSMSIYIGTDQPDQVSLSPDNGGRVIWLWSNNYQSMVSSGQIAVSAEGQTTRMRPGVISVGGDDNHVLTQENFARHAYSTLKTWVQGWVADYITVKGTRYTIWKGEDYNHATQLLP